MQAANIDAVHQLLDVATPLALALIAFIGLRLTNGILQAKLDSQKDLAAMKAEVVATITGAKDELAAHSQRVAADLKTHEAVDLANDAKNTTTFEWIKESLRRIERNGAAPKL
jgi:hypothetical protein